MYRQMIFSWYEGDAEVENRRCAENVCLSLTAGPVT